MSFTNFHPTIKIRLFLVFLTSLSTMAVMPYLIIYFSLQIGTFITGFLFFAVMAANVLGSVFAGYLSDQFGRKGIILWSEFIVFIGFLGAALVNSSWITSPYITFILFVFIQFSTGALTPVYQALIIDVSKPEERKSLYTYSYWLRNVGIAIGSMIGAFLFFDYLFYLLLGVALCTLFSIVITFFFIEETYTPTQQDTIQPTSSTFQMILNYKKVFTHKWFLVFSTASLLIVAVEEQLTNYIGVRLAREISEPIPITTFLSIKVDGVNLLGILKMENTMLVVCFTMLIVWLTRKLNDRFALLFGLLLFFSGYTVISASENPSILIIAMLVASIGEIIHIPVKQTMLASMVPDHARSTYLAMFSIATILGVSTAGIFLIISEWIPPLVLTFLIGMMGFISIALFYRMTTSIKKQSTGETEFSSEKSN
ncbi:MFS transporter [Cytobacillus purgationiresistens]|uniref:DHA1 family multidrug resistance protein B-like MFS transporter n=1 Tax=Cytobacillus purgationiresistens TaxID=863449 RepID=A0ABU0AL40_9BACI|nr:MFS transporter [Cytobacillus purgationiresistens]MDQ0271446.1 DHA1 family multidrug resistance protein B-like MFS transporter [Cytobacillus purgationiresistens]